MKDIRRYLYTCCQNDDAIIIYRYIDMQTGRVLDDPSQYDEVWHAIIMEVHTNKINVLIDTKKNCILNAWL